jgi:plasmid stabilization system protein ParE
MYEVFEHVAVSPGTGRARRELGEGIRSFPHGSHIVF